MGLFQSLLVFIVLLKSTNKWLIDHKNTVSAISGTSSKIWTQSKGSEGSWKIGNAQAPYSLANAQKMQVLKVY